MSLRLRIGLTLVALLLLPVYSAVAGFNASASLLFTISPAGGEPGTSVTVSGSGAVYGLPVQVMLATNGETGEGALAVVQVDPNVDGTFTASLTVPAGIAYGRYAVRAEQRDLAGSLIQYYWVSFQVGGAYLPPTGGLSGVSLTISAVLAALLVSMLVLQGFRRVFGRRQSVG